MRQFAEDEIKLPNGPAVGRKFRVDRNPFVGLWFDEIDSGRWRRFVATGPTGSGKTLSAFIVPMMYHLFEVGETVLCGLPDLNMVADKWGLEIMPVIAASRYRDLLPLKGPGSRGGGVKSSIQFRNGSTLKFMSSGGNDKARAGFHCRVLCVTETDGFDEVGATSREADKLTQLERRTSSFGDRARIYLECTVSTDTGRTWRELKEGSDSKITIRCPHCHHHVTPEREHLTGWRDAVDVIAAGESARVICPDCGVAWDDQERGAANRECLLVHRGQKVLPDGTIEGSLPRTHTLGFRWTAINNLLVKAAVIAEEEFGAARNPDEASAEKKMRQFVWALPHEPDKVDLTALESQKIALRRGEWPRGVVPPDSEQVTVGLDIGGYLCHWTAIAWRTGATPHVIDHGRWEVPREGRSVELALMLALNSFREDVLGAGWPIGRVDAEQKKLPALTLIDAGWHGPDVVMPFCAKAGVAFLATKGFGVSQFSDFGSTGKTVGVGDGYKLVQFPGPMQLLDVNADAWKAWMHERLKTPAGQQGGMTLFSPSAADPNVHLSFAKHLIAERQVEQYIAGKGLVTKYEQVNKQNHWLDATAIACVAANVLGVRLIEAAAVTPPPTDPEQNTDPTAAVNSFRKRW